MDLGRPVARHTVRRAHEMPFPDQPERTDEPETVDADTADVDLPTRPEPSDR